MVSWPLWLPKQGGKGEGGVFVCVFVCVGEGGREPFVQMCSICRHSHCTSQSIGSFNYTNHNNMALGRTYLFAFPVKNLHSQVFTCINQVVGT